MKLRSIAIALAFWASLLSTSFAQQIPKARQQRLIALAKQLHLTSKQAKKLYPIMQAQEPQQRPIFFDGLSCMSPVGRKLRQYFADRTSQHGIGDAIELRGLSIDDHNAGVSSAGCRHGVGHRINR